MPIPTQSSWLTSLFISLSLTFATTLPADEQSPPETPIMLTRESIPQTEQEALSLAEKLEKQYPKDARPESVRMFLSIARGGNIQSTDGWFGPARSLFHFDSLGERWGKPGPEGFSLEGKEEPADLLARLDRNRDGRITPDDLDWSDRNPWVQQSYVANRLFRKIDLNGDGQLTPEEWQEFYKKAAGSKETVLFDDFRDALLAGSGGGFHPGDRPSVEMLLTGLAQGDVGSLQEGVYPGDKAPDFTLPTLDGTGSITLSNLIGNKPTVLVFGNYTCGPFRSMYPGVEPVVNRFKDRANFLFVYVREAHPCNGWCMASNEQAGVHVEQPTEDTARRQVAQKCMDLLKPTIPVVVDGVDDRIGNLYSAMPARLYVINAQGVVTYQSGRGPFGFKVGEMEQALVMTLLENIPKKVPSQSAVTPDQPVLYAASRVPLLSNNEAWKALPPVTEGAGSPLPMWARALAQTLPHTSAAMLELDRTIRTDSQFTDRERGLIRWAAAAVNRSGYGRAYAQAALRASGLTDEQCARLTQGDLTSLDDRDQILFRFAEQLSRAGRDLTDEQVAQIRDMWGPDRLVGIVLMTAYANFQDRLIHALALPLEPEGPLPPVKVTFAGSTAGGSLTPAAERPEIPTTSDSVNAKTPDWSDLSFDELQQRLERQRNRTSRVEIPSWEEMKSRLKPGLYNPNRPLRIVWSRLVMGRQPAIGPAWLKCLRVFGNEAKQNRVFEESMFWVVTRDLRCTYCMGHCEMLMEVGGLNKDQIAARTAEMSKADWSGFPAAERVAFSLASQLTRAPWDTTDADVENLKHVLGEARAIDAIWWIARCQFMTKVSDTFQLPLERENVFIDFEPPKENAK